MNIRPDQYLGNEDGFTFVETLVAFAILFLVLGVSYQAFQVGIQAIKTLDDKTTVLQLLEEQTAFLKSNADQVSSSKIISSESHEIEVSFGETAPGDLEFGTIRVTSKVTGRTEIWPITLDQTR